MADDRIPQAQSDVLEPSGKRFTLPWFRFFAALDGILGSIADVANSASLALLKASNLSDVADAATAFANIKQSANGATTGVVQQDQPEPYAHTIAKVKNVTARFHFRALWAGTIDSTYTDCQAGTATVRWQINGTDVGSAANSISTTADTETHTTDNEFEAGDVITYTITSASSCTEALVQCNVTRELAA